MINRLRIGHSNLNSTLYVIGKHRTGLCDLCNESETVEHILISCREYRVERQEMLSQLQKIKQVENSIKSILEFGEDEQGRKCTVHFLRRTGLDRGF